MVQRSVNANGHDWLFDSDTPALPGGRMRALLRARLVDEISGDPVAAPFALRASRTDVATRATADGLVGLVAAPARVLPELALAGAALSLEVRRSGFLPRTLHATLGPIAGFPASFAPVDLGDVALHREGVVLAGRILQNAMPALLPLAGATVVLDAVWSQLPPPYWIAPALAEPPDVITLSPPLRAERPAGTTLRERALAFAAVVQTLRTPQEPGATQLELSNGDGVAAGTALAIDIDTPAATEVLVIAAVTPASAPDLPVRVTLEHPTTRRHREGVRCAIATPQPVVANATLDRDALPGDPTVFLTAAPTLADGAWAEIDDGLTAPEYARVALLSATTDADGHFSLPPIARIALVRLLVQHPAIADARPIVAVDPAAPRLALALE
ncbi:MAG: hypothetical protein HY855_23050 [Burkholderiales bacterium]|nr:hypothetical protein [Burkholderiales bacterium]